MSVKRRRLIECSVLRPRYTVRFQAFLAAPRLTCTANKRWQLQRRAARCGPRDKVMSGMELESRDHGALNTEEPHQSLELSCRSFGWANRVKDDDGVPFSCRTLYFVSLHQPAPGIDQSLRPSVAPHQPAILHHDGLLCPGVYLSVRYRSTCSIRQAISSIQFS